MSRSWSTGLCWALLWNLVAVSPSMAQLVPGTGYKLTQVSDDFEDPDWGFVHNPPKGSKEQDKMTRGPTGYSTNGLWYEGPMRGQPDYMKVVPTPEGGLEGSQYSLLIRTLNAGVPGRPSYKAEQDDLVANVRPKVGYLHVSRSPSVTTRVFVPPFEQWEQRAGVSFGFRAGVYGYYFGSPRKDKEGKLKKSGDYDEYWPGMFIRYNPPRGDQPPSATLLIRGNNAGHDIAGPQITESGWWTLGMSFTPDGRIHYYASPGVDDLTSDDYLYSSYPYQTRCDRFSTFFYNVLSHYDGRTWSTPWIVDDPAVYVRYNPVAQKPN